MYVPDRDLDGFEAESGSARHSQKIVDNSTITDDFVAIGQSMGLEVDADDIVAMGQRMGLEVDADDIVDMGQSMGLEVDADDNVAMG